MKIISWPASERPREKFLQRGADSLSDAELLAVFLGTGLKGKNALEVGRDLLSSHGSLRSLLDASLKQLSQNPGLGPARSVQLKAALELGKRYLEQHLVRTHAFRNATSVSQFLTARMRGYEREVFAALFLDHQHRLICYRELFFGTLSSATIYPREVVKAALESNAAAVIFAHNHPSGVAEPSRADRQITERLKDALALIDVKVVDHLIVGEGKAFSMAESGWV